MTRRRWGAHSAPLLLAVGLALAVLAAYRGSFSGPFVYDDSPSIEANPTIRQLWPPWRALWPPRGTGLTVAGRPVLNLSLAINYAIGGTSVRGYHAVNLAIHVAAALVLFGVIRRTLDGIATRAIRARPGGEGGAGDWDGANRPALLAFAAALMWAVHPLQTEAVTYVVQRAESLMGLLYLLTLYCFIRCAEEPSDSGRASTAGVGSPSAARRAWAILAVAACALGMATKEVMVSAPLMMLLYDRTFISGSFRRAWRDRRALHLGLASTWLVLGILVFVEQHRGQSAGFAAGAPAWKYWAAQFPAIMRYVRLSIWPHPLVFNYGFERHWGEHPLTIAPYLLGVAALGIAVLVALGRRPRIGFFGAWFFAILAPTCAVPILRQTMAEHRMYLALAPLAVLAVLGIEAVAGEILNGRGRLAATLIACVALATAEGFATAQRNRAYRSELGLWQDTVAKQPGNEWARNNLGVFLWQTGRDQEAIAQFDQVLRIDPNDAEAENNLGNALVHAGRIPEAIGQFEKALQVEPDYGEAHDGLGIALAQAGRLPEAVEQFEAAVRIEPSRAEFENNLGLVLNQAGRTGEAIARFRAALRIKPEYPEGRNNLGIALTRAGRTAEAIAQFREALRIKPDYAAAHFDLGIALGRAGRGAEAIAQYREALRLKPDFAAARAALEAAR